MTGSAAPAWAEPDLQGWLETAALLADAAGVIARAAWRQGGAVMLKPDQSPVTATDQAIEARWRQMLAERHPDHGILGEEAEAEGLDRRLIWVLDPIDGTRAFMTDRPTFTHLIALCADGVPILGLIDQPILRDRWVGAAGRPTLFNGTPCRTRNLPVPVQWPQIRWGTTSPLIFPPQDQPILTRFCRVLPLSVWGGDAYAFGTVASGGLDLMIETGLKPWDYCCLGPVIEGAGGVVSDWQGQPLRLGMPGDVLASAGRGLHEAALTDLIGRR